MIHFLTVNTETITYLINSIRVILVVISLIKKIKLLIANKNFNRLMYVLIKHVYIILRFIEF